MLALCCTVSVPFKMASTSVSAAITDDDLALAEQQFEDGLELLKNEDFVGASDCFAQCLERKVAKFGEEHCEVAPVYLKYAASLFGCARQQSDNVLGSLKVICCLYVYSWRPWFQNSVRCL